MATYEFELLDRFRDRADERTAMEAWYQRENDARALMLHGRRRAGKSWLFRAFAHGKHADIFVASTRALADQLHGFAGQLSDDSERPVLSDLETFLRVLYRRARDKRRLAVIDELPNLIAVDSTLPSTLLKVMEEEAAGSRLKLILTGSHVALMEGLLAERQPLHDRLQRLPVRPLDFWSARTILGDGPGERLLTSYGLAGGMPRYLSELEDAEDPLATLAALTLSPLGRLFDEGRAVLAQELQQPATYFSLLAALALGPADFETVERRSRVERHRITKYLATLRNLGLVVSRVPVTESGIRTRSRSYVLADGFLRFWFRYVFPFQPDLEAGLDPATIVENEIQPTLADHLAPTMEEVARAWVRRSGIGDATKVGAWWGRSLDSQRRRGERTSEEIDIVGLRGKRATVIGEVRWRSKPMAVDILEEIDRFKLPALQQAGVKVADPEVVLVSRSGFGRGLKRAASENPHIRLVGPDDLVEPRDVSPGQSREDAR